MMKGKTMKYTTNKTIITNEQASVVPKWSSGKRYLSLLPFLLLLTLVTVVSWLAGGFPGVLGVSRSTLSAEDKVEGAARFSSVGLSMPLMSDEPLVDDTLSPLVESRMVEPVEDKGRLLMVVWSRICNWMVPCHPGSGKTWTPGVSAGRIGDIPDTDGSGESLALDDVSSFFSMVLGLVSDSVSAAADGEGDTLAVSSSSRSGTPGLPFVCPTWRWDKAANPVRNATSLEASLSASSVARSRASYRCLSRISACSNSSRVR